MKDFFSKFGWALIEILTGCFSIALMISLFSNSDIVYSKPVQAMDMSVATQHSAVNYEVPEVDETMFVVENAILPLNSIFDWTDYVHVQDTAGNDLLDYITVEGTVDTSQYGSYDLTFRLNWNGMNIVKSATFYVNE